MGQSEIQSSNIGKKVMDELKELDKIAYIRFASVYTNFKEIGEFGEYIDELHGKPKKENKPKLEYLKLAFELAKINIGSTKSNPAVGCIVERNGSVISTGFTSVSGRPHAEHNALNKNIRFQELKYLCHIRTVFSFRKNATLYQFNFKKGSKMFFFYKRCR